MQKTMAKLLQYCLLLFSLLCLKTYAQPDYAPLSFASPNSSSFSKYGQQPIGLYTGIPKINIPLYEVVEGDIVVPISISYYALGIKVAEKASSVGLGWNLNVGGSITRQIRGLPDEDGGFINHGGAVVTNLTQLYSPLYQKSTLLEDHLFGINLTGAQRGLLDDIADGRCDGESDIYYFNIPTGSGKFFFKNNREILQMPFQNFKINYINTPFNDKPFNIIDQKGITYDFFRSESIASNGGTAFNYNIHYSSTWSLEKISDQYNNEVDFKYNTYTSMYYEHHSDEIKNGIMKHNWIYTTATSSSIDSIITPNEKVVFYSNNSRIDIQGELTIDSIKVFNLRNSAIKTIKFYHSYFVGIPYYGWPLVQNSNLRLRLDSIQVGGDSYSFIYNMNPLPSRFSYSQDAWGYYNGAENSSLIPSYFAFDDPYIYQGANRCPNPDVVQSSILTDVIYPTGWKSRNK